MSPCLPTSRLMWVGSLPAFAVILSFLWYRRKRGSLKTDSGGAGDTSDDQNNVESKEEVTVSIDKIVLAESEKIVKEEVSEIVVSSNVQELEAVLVKVIKEEKERKTNTKEEKVITKKVGNEKTIDVKKEKTEDVKEEKTEDLKNNKEEDLKKEKTKKVKEKKTENVKEEKTEDVKEEKTEDVKEEKTADVKEEKTEDVKEEKAEDLKKEKIENVKSKKAETTISEILFKEKPKSKNKGSKRKKKEKMAKKSKVCSPDKKQMNMEENTACILEKKLAKLDLTNQCSSNETNEKQSNEDVAERDSANNSPSEVMLASPSVSAYSDTHSENSSDSGKGCSEMLTPSRTPASGNSVSGDLPVTSIYEFVIPQQLVGRLIGRHGSYLNEIKDATHASIYIKRHPGTPTLKICAVEGTQLDIESALEMIRRKFPKKRYPKVTLEQVMITPEPQVTSIISESMQLYLIEGINNDVLLSSLVSAGHFFLQQPTHPTYLSLSRLNSCMMYCYSEPNQPTIPEGVGAGILCAAPVHNGWYRAQITNLDPESGICDVKFVDYGGYMTMPVSMLRQIRIDFVNLPFQAAECYLAGVKPANEENIWCDKAKELVEKLTFGKVLQAQVYGYAEDSVPLIYLYTIVNDEVILINQELVDRGFAEWLCSEPIENEAAVEEADVGGSDLGESAPVAVAV